MSEWRTIDSAPRSGVEILAYDGDLAIVRWVDGDWWGDCGCIFEPTHWMPLPEPPTDATP